MVFPAGKVPLDNATNKPAAAAAAASKPAALPAVTFSLGVKTAAPSKRDGTKATTGELDGELNVL